MSDIKTEYLKGKGPGGQHKNKTLTAVRLTHLPTGIQAYADKRSRQHSLKTATAELNKRIAEHAQAQRDKARKDRRDAAIKERNIIRTYTPTTVTDHRTGKSAPWKQVVGKGRIDLLR